ncbi:(deoxy)nucleoside triphosphate pyrophosphohydrolase [bacterium]|nr:(deoxy)nucleoside triphosphate pyrophosphohydrolase [bacterium]
MIQVSCAIIEKNGHVLAARRNRTKDQAFKWEFPGGKVCPGETPDQALVREIDEELGLKVIITGALPVIDHSYGYKQFRFFPFICRIISGLLVLVEHEEVIWDHPDRLEGLDWAEADRIILHLYLEGGLYV